MREDASREDASREDPSREDASREDPSREDPTAADASRAPRPPSPAGAGAGIPRLVIPGLVAVLFAGSIGWQWNDAARLARERAALRLQLASASATLASARDAADRAAGALAERLEARAARDSASNVPYLVISVADNRLWFRRGEEVLFETRVATGSGKFLEKTGGGGEQWKFETPRGRLVVERKDVEPAWIPPDWHYVEAAQKQKLELVRLRPGMTVPAAGGAVVTISGLNVVTRYPDGREVPFEVRDGHEIRVGDKLIVPPFGTAQRRYQGVLGANRLYLGDGYGIHGTDAPWTIGQSVSHGCIRVRNEDIETLFRIVAVGTPVYVY